MGSQLRGLRLLVSAWKRSSAAVTFLRSPRPRGCSLYAWLGLIRRPTTHGDDLEDVRNRFRTTTQKMGRSPKSVTLPSLSTRSTFAHVAEPVPYSVSKVRISIGQNATS